MGLAGAKRLKRLLVGLHAAAVPDDPCRREASAVRGSGSLQCTRGEGRKSHWVRTSRRSKCLAAGKPMPIVASYAQAASATVGSRLPAEAGTQRCGMGRCLLIALSLREIKPERQAIRRNHAIRAVAQVLLPEDREKCGSRRRERGRNWREAQRQIRLAGQRSQPRPLPRLRRLPPGHPSVRGRAMIEIDLLAAKNLE